jgi:hypothetical protein
VPPATADRPALVTDPAHLAAQDRVLVPEYQQLGILGNLVPGQHHQTAEQTANEQGDSGNDHLAMITAEKSVQARSSNRAPQDHHQVEQTKKYKPAIL